MIMKNLILLFILSVFTLNVFAHEGGHGTPTKKWKLNSANEILKADFVKYEQNVVFLRDENQKIVGLNIADFSAQDKKYILGKQQLLQSLNSIPKNEPINKSTTNSNPWLIVFGSILILLSAFAIFKPKNKISFNLWRIVGFDGFNYCLQYIFRRPPNTNDR